MSASEILVEAKNISRVFGEFTAVDQVNIVLKRGEVFGLLGANGAGKTTAIRMLCGLLPPSSGQIQVASVDMVRHSRHARQKIGYVAQGFALYKDLTVQENLNLQAGLYGLRGKHKKIRVDWAIDHLELGEFVQTFAFELPLGYQRRLSFAAALLHQPQVLFLDEPTSGVDALGRQDFWELIYNLAEADMAVLVTTHYMDEASFCDRLALMHASKIVKEGTPQSLLAEDYESYILSIKTERPDKLSTGLRQLQSIVEVIPHAGGLRISMKKGSRIEDVKQQIENIANVHHIPITSVETASPMLEDIFVQTLSGLEESMQ